MKKIFTLLSLFVIGANCLMANDDNGIFRFDFEKYKLDSKSKYYEWFETNSDGADDAIWASGNAGFAITAGSAAATDYPTAPMAEGYDNACIQLTTKSTGTVGSLFKMPIAAGNLFIGTFDSSSATKNALAATKFGKPFAHKPLTFSGYYKYKAGAQLTDKNGKNVEGTDQGQIYAVFYANKDSEGKDVVLDGSNILTSEQVVAIADAGAINDVNEWTRFSVSFDYGSKTIEQTALANGNYSLAVVFTSSKNGASFTGAVGSVLYVDKVTIEYEQTFTDKLSVRIDDGEPVEQTSSIQVVKHEDGKYTLSLKNFSLTLAGSEMNVGNIVINNVDATEENGTVSLKTSQNIKIEDGDDPDVTWVGSYLGEVPVNLEATIKDNKLSAIINIKMAVSGTDMNIQVLFGSELIAGIEKAVINNPGKRIGIYNLNGQRVNEQVKGQVYITKYADGSTVKTIGK